METTSASSLQLRFKRNDITNVSTTHRNTLRIFPQAKAKTRQKVVVADVTGVATCFGVGKHHELKPEFQTPPPMSPAEVTSLTLYRDQLFMAVGNRITAYTKKGKPFYINETSLSERMTHLQVTTPYQLVAGDFVLTQFREIKDEGFYMSPDKINHLITVPRKEDQGPDVLLAGQDRIIRCVRNSALAHQMGCEAPVTALQWNVKGGDVTSLENPLAGIDLVYGTNHGSLGGLRVAPDGIARRFSMVPQQRLGIVQAVHCADLTSDGVNDVVVARDDGSIELHSFEMNPDGTPVKAWAGTVGETINSLDVGAVTHTDRQDLVVCTFSGKVVTFSVTEEDQNAKAVIPQALQGAQPELMTAEGTAAAARQAPASQSGGENAPKAEVLRMKIKSTSDEVADLKRELAKKKNEFAGQDPAAKKVSTDKLRAIAPTFSMKEKMFLDDQGFLVIGVELDTILDSVSLSSTVQFEVVHDAQSNDETRVSITKPSNSPDSKAKMLAVFRTPTRSTEKSLQLRLRPTEGAAGTVTLFVTPRTTPKSILRRVFDIPALSLHQRVAEDPASGSDPAADPSMSSIILSGNFSIKDAHAWVYRSFLDVPANVTSDECRLTFRNTFSQALLYVRYRRGELFAGSHNLSALAVLRDYVSREAAQRKIDLRIDTRPSAESLNVMLDYLHPHAQREAFISRAMKLLDGLKEIEQQESDTSFLSKEYREILAQAADITKSHSTQPQRLQYVLAIMEKLLHDRTTFRDGTPATPSKVAELHQLVNQNYSIEALKVFYAS